MLYFYAIPSRYLVPGTGILSEHDVFVSYRLRIGGKLRYGTLARTFRQNKSDNSTFKNPIHDLSIPSFCRFSQSSKV